MLLCLQDRAASPATGPAPDEVIRASRVLAHTVNNKLAIPLGVLELLQVRGAVPADLQPLIAAARESLDELAAATGQFQVLAQQRD